MSCHCPLNSCLVVAWKSHRNSSSPRRVDELLYYQLRTNLVQRSWSHVGLQCSNWCTKSLRGVLRIYSELFFFRHIISMLYYSHLYRLCNVLCIVIEKTKSVHKCSSMFYSGDLLAATLYISPNWEARRLCPRPVHALGRQVVHSNKSTQR